MNPPAARVFSIEDPSSIRCDGCGVYDPSLRYASHPAILSFLIDATDRGRVGLRCARCRAIQSAKAMAISLIAGWWSPRGPKRTVEAIRANLKGGAQQTVMNAQLLRGIARFEYDSGNPDFAAMFARAAQSVQPQIENRRFLEELERAGHRVPFPESAWRFAPFAPLLAFALALVAFLAFLIPSRKTEPARVPRATASARQTAAARPKAATAAAWSYNPSADELEKQLTATSPAALARDYFKKRLKELQDQIPVRVRNGDNLWALETAITALGSRPGLAPVLARSPLQAPYANLVSTVRESNRYYHGGAPVELIEREAGTTLNDTSAVSFSAIEDGTRYDDIVRDPQAAEADRAAAAKALLRRDLQIRATVIVSMTRAIDECLRVLPN